MTRVKTIVRAVIPVGLRRLLRRAHRGIVFHRAMHAFLKERKRGRAPSPRVVSNLIYGWDNEDFSAAPQYLTDCLRHAAAGSSPILECGSGLTTILVGVIAQETGAKVWTLEHAPAWGRRLRDCLKRYRIDSVQMCVTPLRDYGDFHWYEPPLDSMPDRFALVICDGPPGNVPGGRYGLLPIMRTRLDQRSIVLFDDAARPTEQAIARRWSEEFGATVADRGTDGSYVRVSLGSQPQR